MMTDQQRTFEAFALLDRRAALVHVDDTAAQPLHGRRETAARPRTGFVENRSHDFTLKMIQRKPTFNINYYSLFIVNIQLFKFFFLRIQRSFC